MPSLKLRIKPTSGSPPFDVEASAEASVGDLKQEVAKTAGGEASQIRLIYKGQILKDHLTLESYGLQDAFVIHMVKSQPRPAARLGRERDMGAAEGRCASAYSVTNVFHSSGPMARMWVYERWTVAMLSDPTALQAALRSSPMLGAMADANPQVAQLLADPALAQQVAQMALNPSLMQEHTRAMDRALSNLESMPGGFAALRQAHEQIQEPLYRAADDAAEQAGAEGADNPFLALFGGGGGEGGRGNAAQAPAQESDGAPAPLSNPWAPPAAGAGAGAGGGGNPMSSLIGSLMAAGGGGELPEGAPGAPLNPAMLQMLQDPAVQRAMQAQASSLLSTEQGREQVRAMLSQHPALGALAGADPAMREALTDPELMRAMMDPANMRAMMQMTEAMQQLQGGPMA
ncbi:hypothetical protein H632_c552p0, partial [Helicosporidium sp. ATCC 50920]